MATSAAWLPAAWSISSPISPICPASSTFSASCRRCSTGWISAAATSYPKKKDWGTTDKKVVDYYLDANLGWFYVRKDFNRQRRCALYTAVVDPEILKDEFNDMVLESGAELLLHSWGVEPIMEGNIAKGVIFESKSGRQAILAKVVIDSTGDGDMFVSGGRGVRRHAR